MIKDPSQKMAGRTGVVKASALASFMLVAFLLIRFTSLRDLFTGEGLGGYLGASGFWGTALGITVGVFVITFFIPKIITAFRKEGQ